MEFIAVELVLVLGSVVLMPLSGCAATRTTQSAGEYVDDAAITTAVKAALWTAKPVEDLSLIANGYGKAIPDELGVPALIVDRNPRPGDAWRNRYKSLCLHDPVWYDHLPYLPFPPNWPVFAPKDKIGDWLEMYTKVMELNYWGSTEAKSAYYDEAAKEWVVSVERKGEPLVLRPKQELLLKLLLQPHHAPACEGHKGINAARKHGVMQINIRREWRTHAQFTIRK